LSSLYVSTLIAVAPDCPATEPVAPPNRCTKPSVARIQFELLSSNPHRYTQEDVLWHTHVRHKELGRSGATRTAKSSFLSKPQPCLRSSPLPKRYGKVALVGVDSKRYASLLDRKSSGLQVLTAFRNSRA
jgi:hypothetical protein